MRGLPLNTKSFYHGLIYLLLRYLNFCSDVLGHVRKQLDKKSGQLLKFCQLIEYTMTKCFLEKSYAKWETSPRLFPKKAKLSISPDQYSKIWYSFFLLFAQMEGYKNILKLRCRPPPFTPYKAFLKHKRGLELVSPPWFLYNFWEKYFSRFVLLTDQISLPDSINFLRYVTKGLLSFLVINLFKS